MKIWNSYGSEHSANIVIVGTFDNVTEAQKAKQIIDDLTNILQKDIADGNVDPVNGCGKFSHEMLTAIINSNIIGIDNQNITGLVSDISINLKSNKIIISSQDYNFQLLLNIMLQRGAKIEIEKQ